jgi:hypothetical protein
LRSQFAITSAVTAITKSITVAAGVFAPGHLGELTRVIPFELADAVLEETRTRERRLRALPSRVGIYFVLAMCLFPGTGYRGRYRTVAFDGCKSVKVPDTPRNRGWLGKLKASPGETGCPVIQLMTLCETGTRALVGAVFGTPADGELAWARKLPGLLDETMLVLMDRGFDAGEFLAEVAATRAQFLVRLTSARRPPVLAHLPDGSFLSLIGGVKVRIIAAEVTVTCADGTRYGGSCRLASTLPGHRACPAGTLIRLYHERWGAT